MDLLVLVPPSQLPHIRPSAGPSHTIHAIDDIGALAAAVRARTTDVVVIDPQAPGVANIADLATFVVSYPGIPIVLFAAVNSEAMHRSLRLAGLGVSHLVARDEDSAALRAAIQHAAAARLADQVLAQLAPALARLPAKLVAALRVAFRDPGSVRTVGAISRIANIARRTCDRDIRRAGLASGLHLVRAARILADFGYLRSREVGMKTVARRVGYGTPDALSRDVYRLTGRRPTELATMIPRDVVDLVAHRLTIQKASPHLGDKGADLT
jgi:AraC-like DNA-binding protein